MSERFFSAQPIQAGRLRLVDDEARHLAAVMRAQPGDEVILFDGSGAEFVARILASGKQVVELEIALRREPERELPFQLTLAVALPKGERQKWLVEKLTELGVTRLLPLITQRGVAQPVEAAVDRLRRTVIEASKQCGRNRLMEIGEPMSVDEHVCAIAAGADRLIADPSGQPLAGVALNLQSGGELHVAVGPEGGFSPAEIQTAQAAGWQPVSLGPRILRVETAAIMLAAWATARAEHP
jgi:16S rRNA (uracil1498-N3)-methyltransferase